jgi:glyoxylase I family protein
MRILGFDHVVLRVRDLTAMIDFYSRVLGCHVEHRQEALGLVHLRAGSALIDLVDVAGPLGQAGGEAPGPTGRNMDHLCLKVAAFDAERLQRELAAEGVEVGETGERFGATGRALSIYLRDPEGNGLELRG